MKMFNILITCLGNICRSPTAEHFILHRLKGHPLARTVKVSSAGLINPGNMAAAPVRKIMGREMGITSIDWHRSRIATPDMLERQSLVLPMGIYEMNGILDIRDHPRVLTYMDWIYGTDGQEVADPYGMGEEDFRRMIISMEATMDDLMDKLEAAVRASA